MSVRERSEEAYRVLHELASAVRPLLKAQGIDVKAKTMSDDIRKESVEELVHDLAMEVRKLRGSSSTPPPLTKTHPKERGRTSQTKTI
jgi:hypothetical protein